MEIMLYGNKKLKLKGKLDTAQERIDAVNENILEDDFYSKYYNPMSNASLNELTRDEEDIVAERWLGIKVVGKPQKREQTKTTLNYLAGFILNAKNYSTKPLNQEFYNLAYREELNQTERIRLDEISKRVVYANLTKNSIGNSVILIRNIDFERLMKKRIKEFKRNESGYTNDFMIKELESRLIQCDKIVREVKELGAIIEKHEQLVNKQMKTLKACFQNENRSMVVELANEYSMNKDSLGYHRVRMLDLIDMYYILTELQQDNN